MWCTILSQEKKPDQQQQQKNAQKNKQKNPNKNNTTKENQKQKPKKSNQKPQKISIPEIYYILAIELFYACKLRIPEILNWKKSSHELLLCSG